MSLRTQVFICVKVRQTSWTTSPKQFVINDSFESLLLNLLTLGSPGVTLIGIGKLLLVIGAWLSHTITPWIPYVLLNPRGPVGPTGP